MLSGLQAQKDSDILMTVGNSAVSAGEFRYIYEKNNGDEANYSEQSLSEYLELYKKFKLKVQEAKTMKLDTIKALQDELAGYRKQLASSFLSDREVIDIVVNEVHERKKQDIEVQHILINVKPTAPDNKKKGAEDKIAEIKRKLATGKTFEELVVEYSEDKNSIRRKGYLGYTTAMLPNGLYDLESALYNNKVGEVVGPVWSKLGCHLIKVGSKRKARGVVKVAHILVKPNNKSPRAGERAKTKADSIYTALGKGAEWADLVKKHSDDKKTKTKGGELPIFGISTYEKAFEDASFDLAEGEYSQPVKTQSGYHIIKLIEQVAPETKDEIKKRIKDKIKTYDRYKEAEKSLIGKIKETSKFKENTSVLQPFAKNLDKDFYSYKWKPAVKNDAVLLTIGGEDVMVSEFADYCKKNTRLRSQFDKNKPLLEGVQSMYGGFVRDQLITYEEANLEEKYSAFKSLMREYQEGILLFEATKISVWDKANQDTVGLQKFYEANKQNYMFDKRVAVGTYTIQKADQKKIDKIMKCASEHDSKKTLKRFNKGDKPLVTYDEQMVNLDNAMLNGMEIKQGALSKSMTNEMSGTTIFRKVVKIEEPRVKDLKEARGYVVADYQDELEKMWLQKLENSYPINLNNEVYNQLKK